MGRSTCLADIDDAQVALFRVVVKHAKAPSLVVVARLDVPALGDLAPAVLIGDLDRLPIDPLEVLRQLRFVLPTCIIVVVTRSHKRAFSLACHLAGASGVLSKTSSEAELVVGLRTSIRTGSFTDPRLAAA
jgi:DNA-binding NarL/FixJ family response regulator